MQFREIERLHNTYQQNLSKFGKYSEETQKSLDLLNKLYHELSLASDRSKVALRHSDKLYDLLTKNWNNNEQQYISAEYAQYL